MEMFVSNSAAELPRDISVPWTASSDRLPTPEEIDAVHAENAAAIYEADLCIARLRQTIIESDLRTDLAVRSLRAKGFDLY